MSKTKADEDMWGPFITSVQEELDNLGNKLKEVVDNVHSNRSPRKIHTAKPPDGSPRGRVRNLTMTDPRRMPDAMSRPRNRPYINPERELISNYRLFPIRANASARIYRPHKLTYPAYRNDKKIEPILKGNPMQTYSGFYTSEE